VPSTCVHGLIGAREAPFSALQSRARRAACRSVRSGGEVALVSALSNSTKKKKKKVLGRRDRNARGRGSASNARPA